MARGHKKGRAFELDVCRDLSNWWAGRDDVFYHTHVSGARATVRGRKGKDTLGSYGDIMALNKDGEKLLDLITFELKKGYNRATVHDLVDRVSDSAIQPYEEFIAQAYQSWFQSGSYSWALIHKRDRRNTIIWMPSNFVSDLVFLKAMPEPEVFSIYKGRIRVTKKKAKLLNVMGFSFDWWLEHASPIAMKEIPRL